MGVERKRAMSKEERLYLKSVMKKICKEGFIERNNPDFSIVDFAERVIGQYGAEPVAVYYGLEAVSRPVFAGHAQLSYVNNLQCFRFKC